MIDKLLRPKVAFFVGPSFIAASLVLLKLDRLSAAGAFRPTQTDATHDEARD